MANPWDSDPIIGGNPWDADPVVSKPQAKAKPKAPQSARPDFGNVRSGFSTTGRPVLSQRARIAKARAEGEAAQARAEYDRMQMGGNGIQQALIGAGDALTTLYRGPKQMATDQALRAAATASMGMRGAGMDSASGLIDRYVGSPLMSASQAARADEAQRRADTESLAGSIPAQAGKIGAYAATAIGPSYLSRGTAMAPVLLPNTIKGNALLGAAYGAAQPYTDGGDQAFNTFIGGAFGGGLAAIPGAAKYAKGLFGPRLSIAERRAGQIIMDMMGGEKLDIQPSNVPGVQRTLGEATLNPDLMRIEDALRAIPETSKRFQNLDSRNNAARVSALQRIAGSDADLASAQAAREAASGPFYASAKAATVPIDEGLQASLGKLPNGVMSKARQLARMDGNPIPDTAGEVTGAQLHYIKLAMDDALGRVGPGSLGNTERRIVSQVKDELVGNIGRLIPDYAAGMTQFNNLSRPINRMQIGRELIDTGSAGIRDAVTGLPRLTPGTFAKTSELDAIAQRATGFKKAKASDILTPDQMQLHAAIMDDLERQFARGTNPAGGSHTSGRLNMFDSEAMNYGGKFLGLMKATPLLKEGAAIVNDAMSKRVRQALADMFADPSQANRVLSALPPAERSAVERALLVFGQGAGTVPVIDRTKDVLTPLGK